MMPLASVGAGDSDRYLVLLPCVLYHASALCQGLLFGTHIWYQNPKSVPSAVPGAGCWCPVPWTQRTLVPVLGVSARYHVQCPAPRAVQSSVWCLVPDTVSGVTFLKQGRLSVPGFSCGT